MISDLPVAIVTAAAHGIGAASAIEFDRHGYRITLLKVLLISPILILEHQALVFFGV